jgi:hypothetical protein
MTWPEAAVKIVEAAVAGLVGVAIIWLIYKLLKVE